MKLAANFISKDPFRLAFLTRKSNSCQGTWNDISGLYLNHVLTDTFVFWVRYMKNVEEFMWASLKYQVNSRMGRGPENQRKKNILQRNLMKVFFAESKGKFICR